MEKELIKQRSDPGSRGTSMGMSAYAVYKGKNPGDKVVDDLIIPEVNYCLSNVL